jgi:hypothetical protein
MGLMDPAGQAAGKGVIASAATTVQVRTVLDQPSGACPACRRLMDAPGAFLGQTCSTGRRPTLLRTAITPPRPA